MGFVAPAMAEPSNTGDFPSTGLMQEDYTYTGAATEENMGVYEGEVNATAEYTDDLYNIVAGNYLKAGSEDENGTQCTQGNFCPGLTNALYNETTDQGLNSCSTATNGIYTLSAAGASSQNDCYRECTTADVAHSRGTMNGGYYYGDNNQCEPTDCVNGWHVKAGLNFSTLIGSSVATTTAYINNSSSFEEYDNQNDTYIDDGHDASYYGISGKNSFAVDYGDKGIITGHGRCSAEGGSGTVLLGGTGTPTIKTTLTDNTGQSSGKSCYCQIDGYIKNGIKQNVSAPWVYLSNPDGCANQCVSVCAQFIAGPVSFFDMQANYRRIVFENIEPTLASCDANIININWTGADAEDISANNAGTATYDSDIRTPVKAQTIKGKTFKGWRFSKPQQTTTGNNG